MTPVPTPTLTARLVAIKEAIGAIGKTSEMTEGPKYRYRGIDAILDAAHEALIEHEVVIVPTAMQPTYEMRSTRNGAAMQWMTLGVDWAICSGSETLTAHTVGEANDTSDKASNKAQTAAYKVLLNQLFAIPFSADDPDADRQELGHAPEPRAVDGPISADNAARLMASCEERGITTAEVVRLGTGGRTSVPTEVLRSESVAVKEAMETLTPKDWKPS